MLRKQFEEIARNLRKEVDYFMQRCDLVNDEHECDDCPLKYNCLQYDSIEDIWSEVSVSRLADFLEYADEVESAACSPYASREAWEDYQANEVRQDDAVYGE